MVDFSHTRIFNAIHRYVFYPFPATLSEFFINLLTDENDVIFDFFADSNTTGFVAESLHRRWLALENVENYLKVIKVRFDSLEDE